MVNTGYFVSPEVIHADLSRTFKSKNFDFYDIVEWCAQVETRYIHDVDLMIDVLEVPLKVVNGEALLPCNVHRVLDVYYNYQNLEYGINSTGTYLVNLKYKDSRADFKEDNIYINYVGTPIDEETGYPLIIKGHENACETFCKLRSFEEDMVLGKFSPQLWQAWDRKFSFQIQNAAYSVYRHKVRSYLQDLMSIRANAIPQIGRLVLYHEKNLEGSSLVEPRFNKNTIRS